MSIKIKDKILIINTGGTFNKFYNKLNGNNEIAQNSNSVLEILKHSYNINYELKNIILKDSLDITKDDRIMLCKCIKNTKCNKILIIHGTDTMDKSSKFVKKYNFNKTIVFIGAMIPYSFNKSEASFNLGTSIGFLINSTNFGVFIAMGGVVVDSDEIKKNKEKGLFELIKR